MKKTIILTLSAIVILSSCASKFSLTKRRYTKGYYIASSKNNSNIKTENTHKTEIAKNLTPKKNVLETKDQSKEYAIILNNKDVNSTLLNNNSVKQKHTVIQQESIVASIDNKKVLKPQHTNVKSISNVNTHSVVLEKKASSDSDLIVQVILSLFPILCLIAIFLHDSKAVTLNFWVDLILHLTFIGEIIFALLVVLDVVNLA